MIDPFTTLQVNRLEPAPNLPKVQPTGQGELWDRLGHVQEEPVGQILVEGSTRRWLILRAREHEDFHRDLSALDVLEERRLP